MEILKFNDFINERWAEDTPVHTRIAAGVAIIYNNRILLVHPTNASWKKGTCGIPKGKLELGEDPMTGAIRELAEETGINITPDRLDPEQHVVDFYRESKKNGRLIYFICNIQDLSEINLDSERIPKSQLQAEEVDWAKFVSAQDAYPITSRSQLIILDRHLTF
jgi:8-oxo-dGTP pyrophosphatase MutT (NUDIX family)